MSEQENLQLFSDNQLLSSYYASKDKQYFGVLYKRYTAFVFSVSLKYLKDKDEAKDMSMHVFEKLLLIIKKQEIENFKAWLYTVIKNECLMKLRQAGKMVQIQKDFVQFSKNNMEFDEVLHQFNEQKSEILFEELNKAIQKLNNEQRKCIEMFYIQEKSYKEVAEATGYDLKQVKTYLQNGKRNLKLILEQKQKSNE